jgi:hypothetical protein
MLAFTIDRRDAVGQDVNEYDAQPPGSHSSRGLHVRFLLERERLGLPQPYVARPPRQRQRDHRVHDPGAERADHRQGQEQRRDRQEDVGHSHDELADRATHVAGHDAQRHTDERGHQRDDEADLQRHPRAQDHARIDVVADLVGAEPVRGARRLQLEV